MVWRIVRAPVWAAFAAVSRLNLQLRYSHYRYIFLLGHMRSGSTLLAHVLAAHPDCIGAGESHLKYQTPSDLSKLVLKTCELLHTPILRETNIVDQINHEYVTSEVLRSERLRRCIILFREPEATLRSMMSLAIWHEKQALDLYVNRLRRLVEYGSVLGSRALPVEYDDLVEHTEETLAKLTAFLNLPSPLQPTYRTHRMTAHVAGYGDPSENIKTGRIVRTPGHEFAINEDVLETATQAFCECRRQLHLATNVP